LRKTFVCTIACLLMAWAHDAVARPLSIVLDFFPNPNHAPLYVAMGEGFFRSRGLDVKLIVPADPSTPVTLAAARTFDVALTPQINYLIAKSEGLPLLSIGALIDRNLGGLLALGDAGISAMGDLAGRRIGYSLAPLEPLLWRTMLECAGVSAGDVELVNVRYATVAALLTHSIDAVGAFRNYETIQVELQGGDPVFFAQEEYCIPPTYDIVLVAHPDLVSQRPDDLRAFLAGLGEGIAYVQSHPATAFERFTTALPDLDDELNRRSFDATLPLYAPGARHDDPQVWRAMQSYLYDGGLMVRAFEVEELYTASLLPER